MSDAKAETCPYCGKVHKEYAYPPQESLRRALINEPIDEVYLLCLFQRMTTYIGALEARK